MRTCSYCHYRVSVCDRDELERRMPEWEMEFGVAPERVRLERRKLDAERKACDARAKKQSATYCEVVDDAQGFKWRIVANRGALGEFKGEWCSDYTSFATLDAPTDESWCMQTWIAGSSYWHKTNKTLCGFPEFTPVTIGENIGAEPRNVKREG